MPRLMTGEHIPATRAKPKKKDTRPSGGTPRDSGVSVAGNAPPKKAAVKLGPPVPSALQTAVLSVGRAATKANVSIKDTTRRQQLAGGRDDITRDDQKTADDYKKTVDYKRTMGYAALLALGQKPAYKDVTYNKNETPADQNIGHIPKGAEIIFVHRKGRVLGIREPFGLSDKVDAYDLPSLVNTHTLLPPGKVIPKMGGLQAGTLKVLDQLTRPLHAVAGGVDAAVTGKNVPHAMLRGVENKDKTTFSKVLKDVGAPKAVSTPLGFGLDIVGDPTTYLTLGEGNLARSAAEKEGARIEALAVANGIAEKRAIEMGAQAARRKLGQSTAAKGLSVKFGGKQVPLVTRATSKVGTVVRDADGKVARAAKAPAKGVKHVAREFAPRIVPKGASKEEYAAGRQAARQERAEANQNIRKAETNAVGLQKRLGKLQKDHPDAHAAIVKAIETDKVKDLPTAAMRKEAHDIRSQLKYQKRLRGRAGLAEGTVGRKGRVTLPEAEDPDVLKAVMKDANASTADRKAAERELEKAKAGRAHAQGRAETQSRSVGGVAAERIAMAAGSQEKAALAKLAKGSGSPREVLDAIDVLSHTAGYQAGGHGVMLARERLANAMEDVKAATTKEEKTHAEAKVARVQSTARARARAQAEAVAEKRSKSALGYFPHALGSKLRGGEGIVSDDVAENAPKGTTKSYTPDSSRTRTDVRPIHEQNPERVAAGKDPFETDIPLVTANYNIDTAEAIARRKFVTHLSHVGREVKPGSDIHLRDGDAVYHVGFTGGRYDIREMDHGDIDKLSKHQAIDEHGKPTGKRLPGGSGRYVVMNRKSFEAARDRFITTASPHTITRGFDKGTAVFKRVATATPAFHARNAIGDTQMAYLAQPGHRLATNLRAGVRGAKLLRQISKEEGKTLRPVVDTTEAKLTRKERRYAKWDQRSNIKFLKENAGEIKKVEAKQAAGKELLKTAGARVDRAKAVEEIKKAEAVVSSGSSSEAEKAAAVARIDDLTAAHGIEDPSANESVRRARENQTKVNRDLNELAREHKAIRQDTRAIERDIKAPVHATLKVAGKSMKVKDFLAMARKHGVIDAGYSSRELRDLAQGRGTMTKVGAKTKLGKVGRKIGKGVQGASDVRENVVRLATFKHGLDNGMSAADAADLSLGIHIDYADLTPFERSVMRRAAPFYTFSARSIPLHARKLFTNPGKFAQYQKVRENMAQILGADPDSDQTQFQQREGGIAVGKHKIISFGLPAVSALNELPTSANPLDYGKELLTFGASMANPAVKTPLEAGFNYSTFFRDQIQPDNGQLTGAPSWMQYAPGFLKNATGFVPDYLDKRSGKAVPGWSRMSGYLAGALMPGPLNYANQIATPADNLRGQGIVGKSAALATGAKIDTIDPVNTQIQNLYAQREGITKQLNKMKERAGGGREKDGVTYTPAYAKLLDQQKAINGKLATLNAKEGVKTAVRGKRAGAGSSDPLKALKSKYGVTQDPLKALEKKYGIKSGSLTGAAPGGAQKTATSNTPAPTDLASLRTAAGRVAGTPALSAKQERGLKILDLAHKASATSDLKAADLLNRAAPLLGTNTVLTKENADGVQVPLSAASVRTELLKSAKPQPSTAWQRNFAGRLTVLKQMPSGTARNKMARELSSDIETHTRYLESKAPGTLTISYDAQGRPQDPSTITRVKAPQPGVKNADGTGFFPAAGTNYTEGQEGEIANRLAALAKGEHLKLTGLSGYRTPQHSVQVGGFSNDPHTKGEASDTPGLENVPEATLNRYGLTRPMPNDPGEADHVQLKGKPALGVAVAGATGAAVKDKSPTKLVTGGGGSNAMRVYARQQAIKNGIDPDTFERQINAESGFTPEDTPNGTGAVGIAQFEPGTAASLGVDPRNQKQALAGAARLMAGYVKKYGSYENALRAYNAGPAHIEDSKGYAETNAYVSKILGSSSPVGGGGVDSVEPADSSGGAMTMEPTGTPSLAPTSSKVKLTSAQRKKLAKLPKSVSDPITKLTTSADEQRRDMGLALLAAMFREQGRGGPLADALDSLAGVSTGDSLLDSIA